MFFTAILFPSMCIVSGRGPANEWSNLTEARTGKKNLKKREIVCARPMKVIPAASQALAKSAFSDRKPYPGWTASAPVCNKKGNYPKENYAHQTSKIAFLQASMILGMLR